MAESFGDLHLVACDSGRRGGEARLGMR